MLLNASLFRPHFQSAPSHSTHHNSSPLWSCPLIDRRHLPIDYDLPIPINPSHATSVNNPAPTARTERLHQLPQRSPPPPRPNRRRRLIHLGSSPQRRKRDTLRRFVLSTSISPSATLRAHTTTRPPPPNQTSQLTTPPLKNRRPLVPLDPNPTKLPPRPSHNPLHDANLTPKHLLHDRRNLPNAADDRALESRVHALDYVNRGPPAPYRPET